MSGTSFQGRVERREAGALESEVLATLWSAERPLAPVEIQSSIGGGLAYNTVHVLKRLSGKGQVRRVLDGRRAAYLPLKNGAEMTADAMHRALDRGPDPIAALQHFVSGLSREEEQALRGLLAGGGP